MPEASERAAQVLVRLDELFEIGHGVGTTRAGLGAGEQQAFELVGSWMAEAGLEVTHDAAGNLYGTLPGTAPGLPEVWSGSHLDTPPGGGRFDGALGVLAALDALATIAASGPVARTLRVVAFRLEEGGRFGRGVFGSRALVGMLEPDEAELVDADGVTLGEAFAALGLGALPGGQLQTLPGCYVETHIEQGPSLAAQGAALGVVSSIAGMAGIEVEFAGRRGHAGTVPMALRSDALAAAARFVTAIHAAAVALPGTVATVGRLTVSPGATNTIPAATELFADLRAPDEERIEALVAAANSLAQAAADASDCTVEIRPRWRYAPVPMARVPSDALARAIAGIGLEPVELASGAGHDAAIMGLAGVPSAMLFVRSDAGGVSHAPEEWTEADAVILAVRALEAALRELAAA